MGGALSHAQTRAAAAGHGFVVEGVSRRSGALWGPRQLVRCPVAGGRAERVWTPCQLVWSARPPDRREMTGGDSRREGRGSGGGAPGVFHDHPESKRRNAVASGNGKSIALRAGPSLRELGKCGWAGGGPSSVGHRRSAHRTARSKGRASSIPPTSGRPLHLAARRAAAERARPTRDHHPPAGGIGATRR